MEPRPRSVSRSYSSRRAKRSSTNLSDLRLAPLSTAISEPLTVTFNTAKSPSEYPGDSLYTRQHSSYIQGKSAPTSPGILSRNSSRRHIGGGLSRRGSLYENEPVGMYYEYAAVPRDQPGGARAEMGSGRIPKAKSEAALAVQPRLSGHGVQLKRKPIDASKSGTSTPRPRILPDDDWLTRAGAATNAMLQESKGQSWLTSRDSATTLTHLESEDDVDDNYEEMAALSASTSKHFADDELSPSNARQPTWGSKYGSRTTSRRTSRRGSATGLRSSVSGAGGQNGMVGYFDEDALAFSAKPDFVDEDEDEEHDEAVVKRLTADRSYGFGGIMDRLMGISLFNVEEHEESATEGEAAGGSEREGLARRRTNAEDQQRGVANVTLMTPPAASDGLEEHGDGGWQDAAWLLSVASKAIF